MIGGLRVINSPVAGGTNLSSVDALGFGGSAVFAAGTGRRPKAGPICRTGGCGPRRNPRLSRWSGRARGGSGRADGRGGSLVDPTLSGARGVGFVGNLIKPTLSPIRGTGGAGGGNGGIGAGSGGTGGVAVSFSSAAIGCDSGDGSGVTAPGTDISTSGGDDSGGGS